jgi:hypothetical protein
MSAPVPPAQHLPPTRSAEEGLRLRESADGILRQFARSKVIPTEKGVKGDTPPSPRVMRPAVTEARTLADLRRAAAHPPTPAPRPVVESGDGWNPADVLARSGKSTKPLTKASLAASALAKMRPQG